MSKRTNPNYKQGNLFTEEELNPNRPHNYRKAHNGKSPIGNIKETLEEIKKNDPERHQEIVRKRQETTKKNQTMREVAKEIIERSITLSDEAQEQFLDDLKTSGKITIQEAIIYSAASKAIKYGDVNAATFVRDTSGNKPKDEVEQKVSIDSLLKDNGVFDEEEEE